MKEYLSRSITIFDLWSAIIAYDIGGKIYVDFIRPMLF